MTVLLARDERGYVQDSGVPRCDEATMIVRFDVIGTPAPQGSKTRTKWGMREDNPATKPWRQAVAHEALKALDDPHAVPFPTGPVVVFADLFFPRPKAHYGTGKNANILKATAPTWHTSKPDADKLARALGDAMTGIVFRDDSQVAVWVVCKHYGTPVRAEITVSDRWSWAPGMSVGVEIRPPRGGGRPPKQ